MNSYVTAERARASRWKATSKTLPNEARAPAPYIRNGKASATLYDFCLPRQHAALTLLPDVRQPALDLFNELKIPWHAGVDGGPSNHLLSSQVQCVNALGAMVTDKDRLTAAFGSIVHTKEVLPIEEGRWLTFEYIGEEDLLNESKSGRRTRGANCTSVDAAFLHTTMNDITELVLVEWKYTEHYARRAAAPKSDETRRQRYESLVNAADGPIDKELLPFAELLQEPFYQLVRQQLLAHELEKSMALGADRVRVLHVLPLSNAGYQASLYGGTRELGQTVHEVWNKLRRSTHFDRFMPVDSSIFLDAEITSAEYVARYG